MTVSRSQRRDGSSSLYSSIASRNFAQGEFAGAMAGAEGVAGGGAVAVAVVLCSMPHSIMAL